MKTDALHYELPPELVARHPVEERDGARMLVLEPAGVRHDSFRNWADEVPAGALVVLNDTRVLRARLRGVRWETGGKVELLLLRCIRGGGRQQIWQALGRASKPLRVGSRLSFGEMQGEVLEQLADGVLSVVLAADDDLNVVLERVGQVPIPPYLARDPEPSDTVRYQTVFAMSDGSVAAPTASLHIAPRTLARLEERGVRTARLTLHVGLGTFRAVTADDLDGHEMHCEWLRVDQSLCAAVREARMRGAPIVAVGTTVVRALETAAMESGSLEPYEGDTRIFIRPGHEFRVVDALLTNFHVPRSTLLALVAAFVGLERVLEAYREAVRSRYRFLSYGDAMWIPQRS